RDKLPRNPGYYAVGDRLARMGRFGQKTGAGFYRYEGGSRTPIEDPAVLDIIREEAARAGIAPRELDADEIVSRCILALVNEGARILEEGIALRPGDIDQVWIHGYGFPVYRGGPMFHADVLGLGEVTATIAGYRSRYGAEYWPEAPLLERLAAAGKGFAQWKDVAP